MVKKSLSPLLFLFFVLPLDAQSYLLKNVSIWTEAGTLQGGCFLLVKDGFIDSLGPMKALPKGTFDGEYDLKGHCLYPALIDSYNTGFQPSATPKRAEGSEEAPGPDKNTRLPLEERGFTPRKSLTETLLLKNEDLSKTLSRGFTLVHVVPREGIVGGRTLLVSPISKDPKVNTVSEGPFQVLRLEPNSNRYPTTTSGILAQIREIKEELLYRQARKGLPPAISGRRFPYDPELEAFRPLLFGNERFLVVTNNMVQQRLAEHIGKECPLPPVLLLSPDFWRRPLPSSPIILPLLFKAPLASRYSLEGEEKKREAEERLYPEKFSLLFKERADIVLAPPDSGDYDGLLKNLRALLKRGVQEKRLLDSLTINPARLFKVQDRYGTLERGKAADFIVTDTPLLEEKSRVTITFVEGRPFEFSKEEKGDEVPKVDPSGSWSVKAQGSLGSFSFTMVLHLEKGNLAGQLVYQGKGFDITEGSVSGDRISFSAPGTLLGDQIMELTFQGRMADKRIEGTLSLDEGEESLSLVANPETLGGEM